MLYLGLTYFAFSVILFAVMRDRKVSWPEYENKEMNLFALIMDIREEREEENKSQFPKKKLDKKAKV